MILIRSFVKMLSTCYAIEDTSNQPVRSQSLYTLIFESKFVQRTQQFYGKQQSQMMKTFNMDKYIKNVDLIFEKEDTLIEQYFDNLSFSLNNSCIYEFMIKNCYEEILKSGLASLLN